MVLHIILADISLIARIFPRPFGARKTTTQLAKYPRVLYVKPSNKIYILTSQRNGKIPQHRDNILHLTVILRGRARYELVYITNEAVGRVVYYQLISGKSEENNCFSKLPSSPITGNCHLFPLYKTYSENIT